MFRSSLRVVLAIFSLISALATWGMTRDSVVAASPEVTDVKIDNFSMTPPVVTVQLDTQVRWTNGDDIPHTVVSEDGSFKSKVLDTDDRFTYTFGKPGTYKYFCSIHPKMTGTVVVQ